MKNLFLASTVKADLARQRIIERARNQDNEENGDIVQTILIIALFVVIVVVVGGILYNAINTQAKSVGACIEGGGRKANCTNYTKN